MEVCFVSMKIAENVELLELTMTPLRTRIYPTLLWDQDNVILVDTGMEGQLGDVRAALASAGVSFDKLTKVILTHQDIDHIGGLPDILKAADEIEVLAHELDKPYIEGQKPLIKMRGRRTHPQAKVDVILRDGQVLPYCNGITVIFTPGHTPGHISLYHQASKTLIAGDALIAKKGKLLGPNAQFTPDMDAAVKSIYKFLDYDIETVICYHGGVVRKNIRQQIDGLIKTHNM